MNHKKLLNPGVLVALLAFGASAEAQVSRVFVSVSGNDGNNCANLDTPCRTISGGIAQVDAKGEVIIITTGSYAGGTITKDVKINAAPGVVAFSGLAFVVNPGVGNTVVLRNLTIKAFTAGTGVGVTHSSGNLIIENCVVDGWSDGISANLGGMAGNLSVNATTLRNNTNVAIAMTLVNASVSQVHVSNNGGGVAAFSPGTTVTLSDSVIVGNQAGVAQIMGASFVSMGNNVIEGNLMNSQGTITTGTLK